MPVAGISTQSCLKERSVATELTPARQSHLPVYTNIVDLMPNAKLMQYSAKAPSYEQFKGAPVISGIASNVQPQKRARRSTC